MRKIGVLLVCVSLCLAACGKQGKGEFITQKHDFNSFNKVQFDGSTIVNISASSQFYVDVIAQENIHDILKVEVKNDVLYLGLKPGKNLNSNTKVTFNVFGNNLVGIANTGSGILKADELALSPTLQVVSTGSGMLEFGGMFTQLNVENTGSGKVLGQGLADKITMNSTGSGEILAFDLPCSDADITSTGSGLVQLKANNTLKVTITGSGNVLYKGNPVITSTVTGSGKVIDAN